MASFPTSKVHRVSRRRLGKGQFVTPPAVTVDASVSTTTVTLTFSVPVVVDGLIPLTLDPPQVAVSQTVVSPTVVQVVFPSTAAAAEWSVAGGSDVVRTFQGGGLAPASGTFS